MLFVESVSMIVSVTKKLGFKSCFVFAVIDLKGAIKNTSDPGRIMVHLKHAFKNTIISVQIHTV